MTYKIRYHVDNKVFIFENSTNNNIYLEKYDDFLLDIGEAAIVNPLSLKSFVNYRQGYDVYYFNLDNHKLLYPEDEQVSKKATLDLFLTENNINALIAARDLRINPPKTLPQTKEAKQQEIEQAVVGDFSRRSIIFRGKAIQVSEDNVNKAMAGVTRLQIAKDEEEVFEVGDSRGGKILYECENNNSLWIDLVGVSDLFRTLYNAQQELLEAKIGAITEVKAFKKKQEIINQDVSVLLNNKLTTIRSSKKPK